MSGKGLPPPGEGQPDPQSAARLKHIQHTHTCTHARAHADTHTQIRTLLSLRAKAKRMSRR